MTIDYLIIGTSAAGITAAAKIRQKDTQGTVVCLTQEQALPYNKCFLVDWVSGLKQHDQLLLRKESFFAEQNITIEFNRTVIRLERVEKKVICADGSVWHYNKLLLAMGARARTTEYNQYDNVHTFYTKHDAQQLIQQLSLQAKKRIVVVGAGITGMECVDALFQKKDNLRSLSVIDRAHHVLSRFVTSDVATFLEEYMHHVGIAWYKECAIASVIHKDNGITHIQLSDGTCLPVDLLITVVGSLPNTEWLKDSGIVLDQGVVVVNQWLQTSDESIYAAGDCIQVVELLSGEKMRSSMWADAVAQGMTAGTNLVTHEKVYAGIYLQTVSHLFGMSFAVMGRLQKQEHERVEIIAKKNYYARIVYNHQNSVQGYCIVGDVPERAISKLRRSLLTQTSFAS